MDATFPLGRKPSLAIGVALTVLALSCLRLTHVHLLWADEDYHLAAAINMLHGKLPYRDFWYDKPPLSALYYLLIGGWPGWPLRLLDAAYILACCSVAFRLSARWWSITEGYLAALLLAFFTTFYLPSAVIPFAADATMMLPHLLAIYTAFLRRPWLAGLFAGIAFAANTKALFVFASCCLFVWPTVFPLAFSFLLTIVAEGVAFSALNMWPGYTEQVWQWGLVYAKSAPVAHPWRNGALRTLNWFGFHAALLAGSAWCVAKLPKRTNWKLSGWICLSFAAVALGGRFAPHYFLQLLPPLVIAASRGIRLAYRRNPRTTAVVLAVVLAIPLIRFGPRYVQLAFHSRPEHWADAAMDEDSFLVAGQISASAKPRDTLLVWGYRPDLYVYTRLASDSRFWDSQPLTGVPADRHLSTSIPVYGGPAEANRQQLMRSQPTWIVDGLGLFNPQLRLDRYGSLQPWFRSYELVGKTSLSLIYHRKN